MKATVEQPLFNWSQVASEQVTPEFVRQIVHGERLMVVRALAKKGAIIPLHRHEHEQFTYLVEGKAVAWSGDDLVERVMGPGDIIFFPSNVPHKMEALEDCVAFDYYSPIREDFLDHTDDYYRDETSEG